MTNVIQFPVISNRIIHEETIKTVNARELHTFLEVNARFNDWINNRIKEYGFEENVDYVAFTQNLVKPKGGRPSKEYYISLDMGKELSMVERNDRGRDARLYFIECEKKAKAPLVDLSRMDLIQIAMDAEQERIALEKKVQEDAPKVAFHDQVIAAPEALSVAQAAKILGTGRRRLFAFLRRIGWVTRKNEPYQSKIETGYMDVKLGSWDHPNHGIQQSVTAIITGKGLTKLQDLYSGQMALISDDWGIVK